MRRFVAVLAAAAAAAGLECPGADVADVAARVEKLGANASTAAVERVLEAAVAASAHARAHRRVALVKTHKTASGTLQALVARVALRLGLRPAAAAWPGKFWRQAMCPEALRRALRGRRADVALRHVFPINDWWTNKRAPCRDRGPWVDGFFRLCRELMGNDVAFLLPLRGAGVRFPARPVRRAPSSLRRVPSDAPFRRRREPAGHLASMLAYYNHTGRGYAGDRDRWNPLAKDLRLLTSGDVESFVEAHLRGAPLDAAGVHVLLVEDLHASLAVARRRLRWSLLDALPLKVGASKRRRSGRGASKRRGSGRGLSEAALPAPAASLALDGVLYRGAVAAHAAAVAAVDRECGGGFPVAAEARLLAALGAAVDRACGVDGAPPLLARLCRFRKTQERAVVQAVVDG